MREGTAREWPIHDIARLAGTTSRALRHYGAVGLLPPSRIGGNGYRYYDEQALVRLQRILMLRQLGLGLPAIGRVLDRETDDVAALSDHLLRLRQEQDRLDRQILAVEHTIRTLTESETLMPENMFDGFDHTQYREEVEEKWGKAAYASGDRWWRSMTDAEKAGFQQQHVDIARDYAAARDRGLAADSAEVQAIAARHRDWIAIGWQGRRPTAEELAGLGDMYVADERFAANYGGQDGAAFVRDALHALAGKGPHSTE
ncbi:MerR family transcriptional regulator [Cryobacterium tepidiphilum]|uniref:MerR family transcriptional regulator n=1 Tax=Cryobacterium tepidiphilum TaxID=2486026 RepID=A0A3M8LQ41_9MICO|nr:MerR family transcriptional regulator [Cryobacterium tepidiphilum]RNE67465.1 MerR family transcriptional regulator [Cryobacterium tepidiphilum]